MVYRCSILAIVLVLASASRAQQPAESVYAPPLPPSEAEGVNLGAVHLDLDVRYMTDYVWRGIERFDRAGATEDSANLQFDGMLSFDLGKAPHPFVGLFVNTQESDPVSNFEEIRPVVGFDWNLRPLILTGGHISYIFQDRDRLESSEVFGKIQIDDSYFLRSVEPLFSPYVMAAYDYDLYNGWYVEAGLEHVFEFEDIGLNVAAQGSVAFVRGHELFLERGVSEDEGDQGLQHYQIGLEARYSLNKLFQVSERYGAWTINGYIYYTDGIDKDLRADTQIWGGAGIGFSY
jgi:hypothetical protein